MSSYISFVEKDCHLCNKHFGLTNIAVYQWQSLAYGKKYIMCSYTCYREFERTKKKLKPKKERVKL